MQLVVRLFHDSSGHAELAGEGTCAGESVAHAQRPGPDSVADLLCDLDRQGGL
jgi:hypothetical protein